MPEAVTCGRRWPRQARLVRRRAVLGRPVPGSAIRAHAWSSWPGTGRARRQPHGRVFTGDRSGDCSTAPCSGRATRTSRTPVARRRLELRDAYVTAAVRCAPPANKPTVDERDTCVPFLAEELGLLGDAAVIVVLGSSPSAWSPHSRAPAQAEVRPPRRAPLADGRVLLCSYHPSQQNTFTGTLTEAMFDAVFARSRP